MEPASKLILIVDDDPNFLEIFGMKLASVGFHVETAASGERAVEKLKTLKPALVLLDMNMPGMSGADTLMKIKSDEKLRATKIAFLTNQGDKEENIAAANKLLAMQLGAVDYLMKTDDIDTLAARVKVLAS